MHNRTLLIPVFLASLVSGGYVNGQALPVSSTAANLIQSIDETAMVSLPGNVHPLAATTTGSTPADGGTPMQHMVLYLKGSADQEAQLEQLIAQQSNPKSPLYHQYLTPAQYGSQFGASQANISTIKAWLQGHGFTIDQVTTNNRAIVFSGNASQVSGTFKTEIRKYNVGGVTHYANATDPQIPAALTGVVGGVMKLHDFKHVPNMGPTTPVSAAQLSNPQFTASSSHYLAPADYATIYDINPLYKNNINGTGQSIAVLARSNIAVSDVQTFRNSFGLKANSPQIVLTGTDPGVVQGDNVETTLDTEWAGAIAPSAAVKVIVSASTNTSDGIDLAAMYAVNNNVASVISLSYGSCELNMGSVELSVYNGLWKEAVAQGMTVVVASGDSGAAGCTGGSAANATAQSINGLCSSTYSTCVGGTQFADTTNPGQYWLPGNNPTYGSAISYIPEQVWNESALAGGTGSWAGGGGQSIYFVKPVYQATPGVSIDDRRDVPDVSLAAAGHDGYLIVLNGGLSAVGGTSAATPSFAGMMALVDQKTNTRQGNANLILYPLFTAQAVGGAAVFHDIVTGNNSVPGTLGFNAVAGYDKASGLGSVDASVMVNHWLDASVGTLGLSASSPVLNVKLGSTGQTTITSLANAAVNSAVTLSVVGVPGGVTYSFATPTIAAPGSGSDALSLAVGTNATPGTYPITVNATAAGLSATVSLTLVIPSPSFILSANTNALPIVAGSTAHMAVGVTPTNGFNATVALSVSGLPTGITATFSPTSISGALGGYSTLYFTAASTVKAGTYPLTITGTGGGVTQSISVGLYVTVPASCNLNANPLSVSVNAGASASLQLTCNSVQGNFNGPLSLSVTGAPAGVTVQLGSSSLTPGSATSMLLSTLTSTLGGKSNISVTASGSGYSQTLTIPLTIVPLVNFSLNGSATTLNLPIGSTGQVTLTAAHVGSFNAPISLTAAGLPSGVTALFTKTQLAAPGDGTSLLTITVGPSAKSGSYPVTITGTGGGITQTVPVTLTIPVKQDFSLSLSTGAITIAQGGTGADITVSTGNFIGGFNSTITVTFTGIGVGMNWTPAGSSVGTNSVSSTDLFTAASYTPAGTYPVLVTATGGGITHTGIVMVTVTKPTASH